MKIGRWVVALVITLVIILNHFTLINTVENLQGQVNSIDIKLDSIEKATSIEEQTADTDIIQKIKADLLDLTRKVNSLDEKVEWYEQDITFWNEQVDNMFGASNARYFKEQRDKK